VLELNTATATMREVLDKVVKRKLGVTDPVIMQGSNLLHESGEDIEEDMGIVSRKYSL
jgi:ubiquitin-like 1-activating enzyme E1 B